MGRYVKDVPRDGYIVGCAGVAVSAVLVVAGVLLRRGRPSTQGRGVLLLTLGLIGLAASAGWLLLGVYIDAVTS